MSKSLSKSGSLLLTRGGMTLRVTVEDDRVTLEFDNEKFAHSIGLNGGFAMRLDDAKVLMEFLYRQLNQALELQRFFSQDFVS